MCLLPCHDVCVCQSYLNEKLTFIQSTEHEGVGAWAHNLWAGQIINVSFAHRFQSSFRSVGFRIYAFPILDDISYFFADSSSGRGSGGGKWQWKESGALEMHGGGWRGEGRYQTAASVDDDDVRLLLLLYGFA